jgi:soluble lytic murein transglycosylase-like protein
MTRAAKITKNPEQQRMYSSSHGLAQVMGWWAPEFKLSWADLYDPQVNLDTASEILKSCMKRHSEKSRYEQIHSALACYNGSTKYADAVMQTIGEKLIARTL